MTCRGVRRRLSAHRDGELTGAEHRDVAAHLDGLRGVRARVARACNDDLDALADVPRLECSGEVASRVFDRLDMENRKPGLAAAVPSLRGGAAADPSQPGAGGDGAGGRDRGGAGPRSRGAAAAASCSGARSRPGTPLPSPVPDWGTERHPLFAYGDVSTPRAARGRRRCRATCSSTTGEGHAVPGDGGRPRRHRLRRAPARRRLRAGRVRSWKPCAGALRARPLPRPPGGGERLPADQPHGSAARADHVARRRRRPRSSGGARRLPPTGDRRPSASPPRDDCRRAADRRPEPRVGRPEQRDRRRAARRGEVGDARSRCRRRRRRARGARPARAAAAPARRRRAGQSRERRRRVVVRRALDEQPGSARRQRGHQGREPRRPASSCAGDPLPGWTARKRGRRRSSHADARRLLVGRRRAGAAAPRLGSAPRAADGVGQPSAACGPPAGGSGVVRDDARAGGAQAASQRRVARCRPRRRRSGARARVTSAGRPPSGEEARDARRLPGKHAVHVAGPGAEQGRAGARRREQRRRAWPAARRAATARRRSSRSPSAPARTSRTFRRPTGTSTRPVDTLPSRSVARTTTTCGPGPAQLAERDVVGSPRRVVDAVRRVDLLPARRRSSTRPPHVAAVVPAPSRARARRLPARRATVTAGGVLSTSKGALSLSPVRASASGLLGASLAGHPDHVAAVGHGRRVPGQHRRRSRPCCSRRKRVSPDAAGSGRRRRACRRWGRRPSRRRSGCPSGTASGCRSWRAACWRAAPAAPAGPPGLARLVEAEDLDVAR